MDGSKLILGTVQFGMNYGIANREGQPDLAKVRAILRRAAEHGIRILDTAAAYGTSETVLGTLLAEDPALKKHFQVVSKIPPLPPDASPEEIRAHIVRSAETSLRNLKLDRLYGLLFHREEDAVHLPVLKELQRQGKVVLCGFSVDGALPDDISGAEMIQVPGNVLDRRFIPFPRTKPRKLFVRSVYLQGLLMMPEEAVPAALAGVIPYRRKLAALAERCGMAPAELYMRYLLSIPEIDGVLTGVDNPDQLDFNARLAERGPLEPGQLREIMELVPDLPEAWIRPKLWPKKQ
ncbi:MAG: aldo/keto reductase [Lentisphaeria bacterium]|nr:aldo/keto reductase [Lentisphaeria bacterium]